MKKPRRREIVELVLLSCGCGVLLYHACGGGGADAGAEAPRERKVFAAERSGAEQVADTEDAAARRRAVEAAIRELLQGVALGQVDEAQRAEAQRSLAALLERWRWGTPENRATGAAVIVQQIFDRAKLESRSAALSLQQVQAIAGVTQELARELLLLAVGSSAGADGLGGELPAGYERITWNQLGGFPYQEGAPLPAEVSALGGRPVGIFGFMLTLGESERLSEIVLVESLWGCCFGSVPEVNQTIVVRIDPEARVEYTSAPVLVTGRLEVGEERQGGFVTSVYRIVDARVSAVAQ